MRKIMIKYTQDKNGIHTWYPTGGGIKYEIVLPPECIKKNSLFFVFIVLTYTHNLMRILNRYSKTFNMLCNADEAGEWSGWKDITIDIKTKD